MGEDIRWQQRFSNFRKALSKLSQSVEFIKLNAQKGNSRFEENNLASVLDELIKEGLIQRFEYTHELAWNVMKDYAIYQGNNNVGGSRDATREAFQLQLISDGQVWMEMINSRNKTSHTYDQETADDIYFKILNEYFPAFIAFENKMQSKISSDQYKLFE